MKTLDAKHISYEKHLTLLAYHRPTRTWRWSSPSMPAPGDDHVKYFRVDTQEGEELDEFDCYLVTPVPGNADSFYPEARVTNILPTYS